METERKSHSDHLAWHETLEIHELVAFQSIALMKLKHAIGEIKDKKVRHLYLDTIKDLEKHITELLQFYSLAPRVDEATDIRNLSTGFYIGDLLTLAKTSVKTYATAITETATPALRKILIKHLQTCIQSHGKVFQYMHENGMYPAYNLKALLQHDIENANMALKMHY